MTEEPPTVAWEYERKSLANPNEKVSVVVKNSENTIQLIPQEEKANELIRRADAEEYYERKNDVENLELPRTENIKEKFKEQTPDHELEQNHAIHLWSGFKDGYLIGRNDERQRIIELVRNLRDDARKELNRIEERKGRTEKWKEYFGRKKELEKLIQKLKGENDE